MGVGIGVLMLLNGIGLAVLGNERMGKLFLLTCSLPSLIYFWLLSKDRNGKFLLTFCLADTSCLWVLAATNLLDTFLGGGQYVLMFASRLILLLMFFTYATMFSSLYRQLLLHRK